MGKRVVDDATLSTLAKELRAASRQSGELVFPEDFIASAHSAHAEGYTEGHESGYKQGMDDFVADASIGDYYNASITTLPGHTFFGRKSITSATLPKLLSAGASIFESCSNLTSVYMPAYSGSVISSVFYMCIRLQSIDLGMARKIQNAVFYSCRALTTIILRNTTVVELSEISTFNGSSFAKGGTGGKIYVPAALIEEYKVATNWSALYAYGTVEFVALEGSEYENADY